VAARYRTGVGFVDLTLHARDAIDAFVLTTEYTRPAPPVVDATLTDDRDPSEAPLEESSTGPGRPQRRTGGRYR